MLIAHGERCDDADAGGQSRHHFGVQLVGGAGQQAVATGGTRGDVVGAVELVAGIQHGLIVAEKPGLDSGRKLSGNENAGF